MVGGEDEFEGEAMRVGSLKNLLRLDGVHRRRFLGALIHDPAPPRFVQQNLRDKWMDECWIRFIQIRIIVFETWYVLDFHLSLYDSNTVQKSNFVLGYLAVTDL